MGLTASGNKLDEVIQSFLQIKAKIVNKLGGRLVTDLKDEKEIKEMRALYLQATQAARKVKAAAGEDDRKIAEEYDKMAAFCAEKAQALGSKSRNEIPKTTFDDIKGLDNVKALVKSFIFMAKNPELLKRYGMEGGLGMLLYGAPGTGKTMFAEAIAHEMGYQFFLITPADIFKSYVGQSEQAVRELFDEIDACDEGAILFVDECESIFSKRTNDTKDYKAAVTTEFLQRMNGFGGDTSKRIMVGATNRPDQIDIAYLRYKRFSHQIHVTPPDDAAMEAIIKGKLKIGKPDKAIPLAPGLDAKRILEIAKRATLVKTSIGVTESPVAYYSAADLCGALEEACRIALEEIEKSGTAEVMPLTEAMFVAAFEKYRPSISKELYEAYKAFKSDKTALDKVYSRN